MFVIVSHFYPSLIFADKAEASYGTQLGYSVKLFTALPANTRLGWSCYRFLWIIHWVSSLIWFQHCQGILRIQFWQFTDCLAASRYQFWQFFFTKSSVLIKKCCKKPDSLLLTLFRLKQNRKVNWQLHQFTILQLVKNFNGYCECTEDNVIR